MLFLYREKWCQRVAHVTFWWQQLPKWSNPIIVHFLYVFDQGPCMSKDFLFQQSFGGDISALVEILWQFSSMCHSTLSKLSFFFIFFPLIGQTPLIIGVKSLLFFFQSQPVKS